EIVKHLDIKKILSYEKEVKKERIFFTGEGSSRIFPAKKIMYEARKKGYKQDFYTDCASQALDYKLLDSTVFVASNSGKTKEDLELIRKLKRQNHDNIISIIANELSGGNQQKVVIGRGILTNPDIILMDDPTKGIDIQAKEEFYVLMKSMCKVGISIIWNSSEDQELLSNANRIIVFNEGKIVDVLKGKRMNEFDLYNS
ncbi:unnamed protein product, partial [marine sediment metagenome]